MRTAIVLAVALWGSLLPALASANDGSVHPPAEVRIVGGEAAISAGSLAHIRQCVGATATRLAGANRYETASDVAALRSVVGGTVYVASGERFPDALAAGAAANAKGSVLVLVRRDSIPQPSLALLDRVSPDRIVIAGGEAAISSQVETLLRDRYANVTRAAGPDRYTTSVAIAKSAFPAGADAVIIATGDGFVDALAAAPLAALLDSPLILTSGSSLPQSVLAEVVRLNPSQIFIIGGTAAVKPLVEATLRDNFPSVDITRIAGSNRFETARRIATFLPEAPDRLLVVTSRNFPDALAAGAVTGINPLVLVDAYGLDPGAASLLGATTGASCAPMVKLGSFTTYYPSGQSRVTNIHLISKAVDGAVIPAGEVFSINERTGKRTEKAGYVRAGAIIGGRLVCCDSETNIGGGTSQFATTLYNASFYAALEDVYHRPHSVYFSRYPLGIEATLNWTSPDVKFRNDTAWPVAIDTSYTSTSVTVDIWGWSDGRRVSASVKGAATTSGGGSVDIVRVITYRDGSTSVDRWHHRYNALRVTAPVHTDPEPAPPEPDPTSSLPR